MWCPVRVQHLLTIAIDILASAKVGMECPNTHFLRWWTFLQELMGNSMVLAASVLLSLFGRVQAHVCLCLGS